MSEIHLRQIKSYLQKIFNGLIDLSDYQNKSETDRELIFLTRSLAAFTLMVLADISPQEASKSIIDGGQDNGIDSIYFDRRDKIMYILQSKWKQDSKGSIKTDEVMKFTRGFKDLVNARYERFNSKFNNKTKDIEEALNDAGTRFEIILAYSGQTPLADEPKREIDDLLGEMNDPIDIVSMRVLNQSNIYNIISQGASGNPINLDVCLFDWGQTKEPYQSYYGQISAREVADWWTKHSPKLFSSNIRLFVRDSEVNEGIINTVKKEPEKFWYYNNGITALCSSIGKKPLGGSGRDTGIFECKDVKIVNGAQTVGSIARAYQNSPEQVEKARVLIRFISLENCPEEFATEITRFNNTQNRIDRREFVALDPEQERIKNELQLEGIIYTYKSGESIPDGQKGFDLNEATISRACKQNEVSFATRAKDKISALWENIEKAPYKTLFNRSVNGSEVWKLVQILRVVDNKLSEEQKQRDGRERLFAIHSNRLILHLVYKALPDNFFSISSDFTSAQIDEIQAMTSKFLVNIISKTSNLYPNSYPANTFRNVTKCQEIIEKILNL
ncbi:MULTISPECIES: AIPR family protein [unclassified Nostoc]|uniref:AIPR family protein n=1 Tax=unclassified Nostoc TaxID=2593658 RepID=UPI002AD2B959|nr:AIPR family protein [Nostoc sp. DedQUE03]MDZ7977544.1 AIPR family protein [Nostoc sp. DedQUE03]MDZ8046434.1 AIPR family protein [Nostoc sp. DedQUE02]